MARTFLKGIRVASREELKQRILQGVCEMNLAPVVMTPEKVRSGVGQLVSGLVKRYTSTLGGANGY